MPGPAEPVHLRSGVPVDDVALIVLKRPGDDDQDVTLADPDLLLDLALDPPSPGHPVLPPNADMVGSHHHLGSSKDLTIPFLRQPGPDDLLTFSRGGEPLRSFQEVEPLLHEAAENCNGRGSYQIEYRVSDDLPRVFLDRDQIVEALQQLITNAMEAMPRGGTITIVAELCDRTDGEREPQLCIRVIDIGQGIPDENQKKIFELNFTTKDGAAGLGLPLARSVIQKHGGEIEVSSGPGGGTIVTFMIPIGHDRPLDLAPRLPTGRTRVLIMDDEEAITDILRIWLTRRGYDPVITDDGVSAIQAYQEAMIQHRPFDIVFLDLIVPGGMGGEETMRGLLSLDRAVRAVVCSGYSNDPVMASYLDYGFVGLLPKPFQLTAMEELIQSILLGTKGAMPSDPNNSVISDQPE